MNILILDGNPAESRKTFNTYIKKLTADLAEEKHGVKTLTLRDMEIKFCTGCWSCWWGPTPGECVFKDDSHTVCREYINSDLVIFTSPVIMGFTSALLKKTQDKLIPLLHLPKPPSAFLACTHHLCSPSERMGDAGMLF